MLKNLRNEIEWFKNNLDYVYLDSGVISLKLKFVVDNMVYYCNNVCINLYNDDLIFVY